MQFTIIFTIIFAVIFAMSLYNLSAKRHELIQRIIIIMSTALSSYIPVKTCSKGEMKLTDNYVHN